MLSPAERRWEEGRRLPLERVMCTPGLCCSQELLNIMELFTLCTLLFTSAAMGFAAPTPAFHLDAPVGPCLTSLMAE